MSAFADNKSKGKSLKEMSHAKSSLNFNEFDFFIIPSESFTSDLTFESRCLFKKQISI